MAKRWKVSGGADEEHMSMAKRRKVGGGADEVEDRLSQLHDSLIGHILSFLPIKEAARTCLLSKRWRDAWASVPDLHFVIDNPHDADFAEAVMSRRAADIRRFHLSLPRSWRGRPLTYHVESWVERALELNARHVKIELQHDETEALFLDALFNHERLESLELDLFMPDSLIHGCPVELCNRVALRKLRVLDLGIQGKICGESLRGLVSNCPMLEELYLEGWFDVLDISAPSLKKLGLIVDEVSQTNISCPNLESFTLYYHSYLQKGSESFQGDMPSLDSANIASDHDCAFMDQVLSSLSNVTSKHIHMGS